MTVTPNSSSALMSLLDNSNEGGVLPSKNSSMVPLPEQKQQQQKQQKQQQQQQQQQQQIKPSTTTTIIPGSSRPMKKTNIFLQSNNNNKKNNNNNGWRRNMIQKPGKSSTTLMLEKMIKQAAKKEEINRKRKRTILMTTKSTATNPTNPTTTITNPTHSPAVPPSTLSSQLSSSSSSMAVPPLMILQQKQNDQLRKLAKKLKRQRQKEEVIMIQSEQQQQKVVVAATATTEPTLPRNTFDSNNNNNNNNNDDDDDSHTMTKHTTSSSSMEQQPPLILLQSLKTKKKKRQSSLPTTTTIMSSKKSTTSFSSFGPSNRLMISNASSKPLLPNPSLHKQQQQQQSTHTNTNNSHHKNDILHPSINTSRNPYNDAKIETIQPITTNVSQKQKKKKKKKKGRGVSDNFVRLDLKNKSGSCRRRIRKSDSKRYSDSSTTTTTTTRNAIGDVVDPIHGYLDGTTDMMENNKCPRHIDVPCALHQVNKKNKNNNAGRWYYKCCICQSFVGWKNNNNNNKMDFVSRQIAMYQQLRWNHLTVPELKQLCMDKNLLHDKNQKKSSSSTYKKAQLMAKLKVWARDQLVNNNNNDNNTPNLSSQHNNNNNNNKDNQQQQQSQNMSSSDENEQNDNILPDDDSESDNDDESTTCDEEELELCLDSSSGQNKKSNLWDKYKINSHVEKISQSQDSSNNNNKENLNDIISEKETTEKDSGPDNNEENESSSDMMDEDELEICSSHPPLSSNETPSCMVTTDESILKKSLYRHFGFTQFRAGQHWAIQQCLSKKRSLLVAPTGAGKSLCYALPAAIMDGTCLVISPLISLMQDQVSQLPPSIPAAMLGGDKMNIDNTNAILDDFIEERLKILFTSPERLTTPAFQRLLRNPKFPKISLLCVDEAHCLSQWGHNFRPAYLRLKSTLSLLKPESVLALTATAGSHVVKDICEALEITHTNIGTAYRDNIQTSAAFVHSMEEQRELLIRILKSSDKGTEIPDLGVKEGCLGSGSVIIYVWRKMDAEIITEQLSAFDEIHGGIVCYHGGMDSSSRFKTQQRFMRGKARICVATVAFGLGIHKSDVAGVIHLCLPSSTEHYLQEIGRAGRNGHPAKAIALVVEEEAISKHSLAHSDRISSVQIKSLWNILQDLTRKAHDSNITNSSDGGNSSNVDIAVPIESTVQLTDLKQESIETILCKLEEQSTSSPSLLKMEGNLMDSVYVTLKQKTLSELAVNEPVAKAISLCGQKITKTQEVDNTGGFIAYSQGAYEFSIVSCARALGPGAEPRHVYATLRRLQNCGELEYTLNKKRYWHLKITSEGIIKFVSDDSSQNNGETIVKFLTQKFILQHSLQVEKVERVYEIMRCIADTAKNAGKSKGSSSATKLRSFKKMISEYFSEGENTFSSTKKLYDSSLSFPQIDEKDPNMIAQLRTDIMMILQDPSITDSSTDPHAVNLSCERFPEYSALSLCKILHSIETPRMRSSYWRSSPLWGKWKPYKFQELFDFLLLITKH